MIVDLPLEVRLEAREAPDASSAAHVGREAAFPAGEPGLLRAVRVGRALSMGADPSLARGLAKKLRSLGGKAAQLGKAARASRMCRPASGARPLSARRSRLRLVEGLLTKATCAHVGSIPASSGQVKTAELSRLLSEPRGFAKSGLGTSPGGENLYPSQTIGTSSRAAKAREAAPTKTCAKAYVAVAADHRKLREAKGNISQSENDRGPCGRKEKPHLSLLHGFRRGANKESKAVKLLDRGVEAGGWIRTNNLRHMTVLRPARTSDPQTCAALRRAPA